MVSINLHFIYLLVLAGGTINLRNILAKRCHQIAVCLLSCWQIGAINFQLSAVMCQQRVHTICRGRLTRRVFLSRGKLGNLHSLISDVHRFAVYQLPCYRISCYLQLSASIFFFFFSKRLLSICSVVATLSLHNGYYQFAVIRSNVLANGCHQFAVYSLPYLSKGSINLQFSAWNC